MQLNIPSGRRNASNIFEMFFSGDTDIHARSNLISWWRHQMETFSALLALCAGNSPVTGESPSQRPMSYILVYEGAHYLSKKTWSFDVFFDLRLIKRLSKQSWGWWFEKPSCSLWHHCNVIIHVLWVVVGVPRQELEKLTCVCRCKQSIMLSLTLPPLKYHNNIYLIHPDNW